MALICGVEEAGRGPVIGPMVMCGVVIDEKDEKKLKTIGVKDSKQLTPKQREDMFDKIKKMVVSCEIVFVMPDEIDKALRSADLNLNWLEALTSAKIINKFDVTKAILDCPSNNVKSYSDYVESKLSKKVKLIAEHKADEKYLVVGAASVIAKVSRDREIEKIKKEIGIDFGSGYPSDPKTIDFLKKNWDKYPHIFRKTWLSYINEVEASKQTGLSDF